MRQLIIMVFAIVAAGFLGGLPVPVTSLAGNAGATSTQTVNACSLLTQEEIRKITGRRSPINLPPQLDDYAGGGTVCSLDGGGLGGANVAVEIILTPGYGKKALEGLAKGQERVSGIGDGAYSMQKHGAAAVFALVGQYGLRVGLVADAESGETLKALAVAIAKAAAAKLH